MTGQRKPDKDEKRQLNYDTGLEMEEAVKKKINNRKGLINISKEIMSPEERWKAVLSGKKPDRIPLDYWATEEFNQKLKEYLNLKSMQEVFEELHIDRPIVVAPEYNGPSLPDNTDIYGCRYKDISYETGVYSECISHPLSNFKSIEEIKNNYQWPKLEWYNFSNIPEQIKGNEKYPIQGGGSEPFLIYKNLRGQEQAFIDLVQNQEIVEYCLDELFSFAYEKTKRIYEQIPGKVMITYVAEDMGSENNLMYSPEQIKKFFFPGMKKMINLAHEEGAYVMHHNDGAIRKIIPDLIDLGIDILNPVQWRCQGMERESLKKDFGDDLVFHGGMDNQYTLAFGSRKEIKKEVIDNINTLGKNSGYILAPCHNIQAVSSPEKIVYMYETAYRNGYF